MHNTQIGSERKITCNNFDINNKQIECCESSDSDSQSSKKSSSPKYKNKENQQVLLINKNDEGNPYQKELESDNRKQMKSRIK